MDLYWYFYNFLCTFNVSDLFKIDIWLAKIYQSFLCTQINFNVLVWILWYPCCLGLIAQNVVVLVVMPCSLVLGYLHWEGTSCLQFSSKYKSSCTTLHGSITLKTVIWVGLTSADLNKEVFFRAINMAFNNSTYIVSEPFHIHWYGFGYCIFKTVSSAHFYHSLFILSNCFFVYAINAEFHILYDTYVEGPGPTLS